MKRILLPGLDNYFLKQKMSSFNTSYYGGSQYGWASGSTPVYTQYGTFQNSSPSVRDAAIRQGNAGGAFTANEYYNQLGGRPGTLGGRSR